MERLPQHSPHLRLALRLRALAPSPPWAALARLPPPRLSALPRRQQIRSARPVSRSLRLVLRQPRAACLVRWAFEFLSVVVSWAFFADHMVHLVLTSARSHHCRQHPSAAGPNLGRWSLRGTDDRSPCDRRLVWRPGSPCGRGSLWQRVCRCQANVWKHGRNTWTGVWCHIGWRL